LSDNHLASRGTVGVASIVTTYSTASAASRASLSSTFAGCTTSNAGISLGTTGAAYGHICRCITRCSTFRLRRINYWPISYALCSTLNDFALLQWRTFYRHTGIYNTLTSETNLIIATTRAIAWIVYTKAINARLALRATHRSTPSGLANTVEACGCCGATHIRTAKDALAISTKAVSTAVYARARIYRIASTASTYKAVCTSGCFTILSFVDAFTAITFLPLAAGDIDAPINAALSLTHEAI
jgi:hypothetical protein